MRKLTAGVLLVGLIGCALVPLLLGCISFGSSTPPSEHEKDELQKLPVAEPATAAAVGADEVRRKEERNNNALSENHHGKEDLPQLNDAFVKTYLKEFGYLKAAVSTTKSKEFDEETSRAIRHFQEFMGIVPATGKMDFHSTSHMVRKRCSNPDLLHSEEMNPLWERSSLKWHLLADDQSRPLPKGFEAVELREMIRQAFSAWEIVISMEFLEETTNSSNADILFVFGGEEAWNVEKSSGNGSKPGKPRVPSATTGLGVAYGTEPVQSRIWLHRNENWSTFQVQEEGKLDIFLVLIHEIGHTLGLRHSSDKNSVMFPIFEKDNGEQLPVISNDDVERLRALYDPNENGPDPVETEEEAETSGNATQIKTGAHVSPPPAKTTSDNGRKPVAEKCPRALWAATQVSNGDLAIFMDVNCWLFNKNRQPIGDGPKPITEVFPGGPSYVDVAISAGNLTVLIQERTLYGYNIDRKTGQFSLVKGYPRSLHSRVLFYPEAAFPLTNGSVILLRDNVFATYDLSLNEPTMLNDKTVYFPKLPDDVRSGILQQIGGAGMEEKTLYWIFNGDAVYTFDAILQNILNVQPLADFLKCQTPGSTTTSVEKEHHHPKSILSTKKSVKKEN